jgi:hypothetical protein
MHSSGVRQASPRTNFNAIDSFLRIEIVKSGSRESFTEMLVHTELFKEFIPIN